MRPDICRGAGRIHATGKTTDAVEIVDLGSRTTELIAYKDAWKRLGTTLDVIASNVITGVQNRSQWVRKMKRDKSPCIDVCNFSSPKGWCRGCGRTRLESKNWKSMKPYAKKNLQKQLKKRLKNLNPSNTKSVLAEKQDDILWDLLFRVKKLITVRQS